MRVRLLLAVVFAAMPLLVLTAPAHAEADQQFTFAARLMQQGESDLAEEAFEEFIAEYPDDRRVSDAHYYLALLARQAGDQEEAAEHLAQVDEVHQVPAGSLGLLRGQLAIEANDPEQAIEYLEAIDEDALEGSETRATYHYLLGTAYRGADNLDAAAVQFDRASDAGSSVRGSAMLELGKTRMRLGQETAAIEALRAALDESIGSSEAAEARYFAAELAYEQRHYEMAIDFYQQVMRRHQGSGYFRSAVIGLLRALGAAGEDQQLLERYANSRNQLATDDHAEALYLVARSQVRLGQYEQALAALDAFQRRYDEREAEFGERVAHLRAVCLYQTDLQAFEQWLEELEDSQPDVTDRAELRYLRAQAAVRREEPAEAVEHLTPLIDQSDNDYARRALRQRAQLNEQLNRPGAAADDYAAFADAYPDDRNALDAARRAVGLAFSAGQFEQVVDLAEDYLDRTEAEDGDTAAAVRLRQAAALMRLDRGDEALAVFDRLLADNPADRIATMAHYYRGLLLARRAQADDADESQVDAAVEALERALEGSLSDQQRAEAITLAARMHRMAGRESESLDLYDQLRRERAVEDFDPKAALWIGRGLHERGSHEAALPWLETVIERGEDESAALAEALYLAGRSHAALEQHEQAVRRFRQVVAYSHGYGDRGRLGLARALAASGQVDEALNEYEGLLHVEGSEVAAAALLESARHRVELADRLRRGGDRSGAESERKEARRRLNRVVILYDLPELGAIPHLAKLRLGRLLAEEDRADAAAERLEALAEDPDAGDFRELARAELALLNGSRGEAVDRLRSVREGAEEADAAAEARRRLDALGESS